MTRPLRVQYPHAVYHVMNRGLGRQAIFHDRSDYDRFLLILAEAWGRWRFELYAYCLMGNHYHLCLKTPEPKLSRIMRHINGVYTQRYNRAHRRDGPLFRGRYKAMLIESEQYLGQVVRYIHLNPVDAGLAKRPEAYKWSSHKDYLSRTSPSWLSKAALLEYFESSRAFHEFVLEGNEKTLSELHRKKRWPVILGSEDFIERIRSHSSRLTKEHVRKERQWVRPSLQKILESVAREFRVSLRSLIEAKRGETNLERKVALWAYREFGDSPHGEIASAFGLGSAKTVGWACQEIQKQALKNRGLRNHLKRIEQLISQPET